jgi:hypothetical protein
MSTEYLYKFFEEDIVTEPESLVYFSNPRRNLKPSYGTSVEALWTEVRKGLHRGLQLCTGFISQRKGKLDVTFYLSPPPTPAPS